MSTVIVCLDGASNMLVRGFAAIFSSKQTEWTWGPSPDSLTALRTAQAMRRGDIIIQQERRQVWEARQGQITETVTLWDLPQSIYALAFLNAEEDLEPETFGRRALENKQELDTLLNSMADAATICVAIDATALRMESTEAAQHTAWLLRAIFRFTAALPCGDAVPLIIYGEERPSATEEEWLKVNLPALSSLDTLPKVFFADSGETEAVVKLALMAHPAVLAIYERARKARQALCEALEACKTTPSNDINISPGIVRSALNAYMNEIKQLRWPLSLSLLDDGQPLPDLNMLETDLDTLDVFIESAPAQLLSKDFSAWLAHPKKLNTLEGKRLAEATQKRFTDARKKRMNERISTIILTFIAGASVLLFILVLESTQN